jgi:hypothetical protein
VKSPEESVHTHLNLTGDWDTLSKKDKLAKINKDKEQLKDRIDRKFKSGLLDGLTYMDMELAELKRIEVEVKAGRKVKLSFTPMVWKKKGEK